jgi:23S rRNA (guanine745-N1)-methyltransferase
MISTDRRKPRRLSEAYRDYAQSDVIAVNYHLEFGHADLTALVTMGPSARHITPQDLAARIRRLPVADRQSPPVALHPGTCNPEL